MNASQINSIWIKHKISDANGEYMRESGFIRAINEVTEAIPQLMGDDQTGSEFTCKGCSHTLPASYKGNFPDQCYLCDKYEITKINLYFHTYCHVDVKSCARCGCDHNGMAFQKFERPIGDMTHWGLCPNTSEPVIMRFEAALGPGPAEAK